LINKWKARRAERKRKKDAAELLAELNEKHGPGWFYDGNGHLYRDHPAPCVSVKA
jgi:hypothetical protein